MIFYLHKSLFGIYIRDVEIEYDEYGKHKSVKIIFGPHHCIKIKNNKDNCSLCLVATHHGFIADATEADGELSEMINNIRDNFPKNKIDNPAFRAQDVVVKKALFGYKSVHVAFGEKFYLEIKSNISTLSTLSFFLSNEQHGFIADAKKVSGELEHIIGHIRTTYPQNKYD